MNGYQFHHLRLTAAQYNFLWGFWQKMKREYCLEQGYFVNHPFYQACEENRKHCMEMNMKAMGLKRYGERA